MTHPEGFLVDTMTVNISQENLLRFLWRQALKLPAFIQCEHLWLPALSGSGNNKCARVMGEVHGIPFQLRIRVGAARAGTGVTCMNALRSNGDSKLKEN